MFFVQLKVPILLQSCDDAWQERDQAFRANAVERLPGQHQGPFPPLTLIADVVLSAARGPPRYG